MKALNLFFLEENMKISNYFAKEKMDDATFIQTFIEKLNDLTDEDICWANSDLLEDNENVQSLLMEMVLSFFPYVSTPFCRYQIIKLTSTTLFCFVTIR
jgi:hypothetical protein